MKNLEEVLQSPEYKNLIADTKIPVITEGVLLTAKQGLLKYGSVLAVKENGAVLLSKDDIGKCAVGILAESVDTNESEESVLAEMYITGIFNEDALLFAEGTTVEDAALELRKLGIYIQKMYD